MFRQNFQKCILFMELKESKVLNKDIDIELNFGEQRKQYRKDKWKKDKCLHRQNHSFKKRARNLFKDLIEEDLKIN